MEGTATVEQAEPQGSAAPGQDTSAPASGQGPASPESFGSLYRQHVERRAARRDGRAEASSAGRETSAADEQPAPSSQGVSRPGAASEDVDDPAGVDAGSPADSPRLTRAQRKALKTGQPTGDQPPSTATADTSTAPSEDDDDPVIARVDRVEQTVTEGLSRLEGLLGRDSPDQQAATDSTDPLQERRTRYGDDAEFSRRAQIAQHGSATGQYLDATESEELATWALRREGRADGFSEAQSVFSAVTRQAAEEFGIDASAITRPGATFRDVFGAFVAHGAGQKDADLAAANEKIANLEASNRLLADENEAMQKRLPATARGVLPGGSSGSTRDAQLADRSRMNGRQLMASGIAQRMQGRRNRPGAR